MDSASAHDALDHLRPTRRASGQFDRASAVGDVEPPAALSNDDVRRLVRAIREAGTKDDVFTVDPLRRQLQG
jgi:hypothetical protein